MPQRRIVHRFAQHVAPEIFQRLRIVAVQGHQYVEIREGSSH
jgi:hypothetical protein